MRYIHTYTQPDRQTHIQTRVRFILSTTCSSCYGLVSTMCVCTAQQMRRFSVTTLKYEIVNAFNKLFIYCENGYDKLLLLQNEGNKINCFKLYGTLNIKISYTIFIQAFVNYQEISLVIAKQMNMMVKFRAGAET